MQSTYCMHIHAEFRAGGGWLAGTTWSSLHIACIYANLHSGATANGGPVSGADSRHQGLQLELHSSAQHTRQATNYRTGMVRSRTGCKHSNKHRTWKPVVRDSEPTCFQAMDFFVKLLHKASADIAKGVDPSKPPSDSAAADASKAATSVTSFLGWAMTSVSAASSSYTATASAAKKPAADSARAGSGPQAAAAPSAPVPTASAQPTPPGSDAFDDGWGDDDDLFEDMAGGAAPAPDAGAVRAAAADIARDKPALVPIKTGKKPSAGTAYACCVMCSVCCGSGEHFGQKCRVKTSLSCVCCVSTKFQLICNIQR